MYHMYVNDPTGWRCAGIVSGEMRVKTVCACSVACVHWEAISGDVCMRTSLFWVGLLDNMVSYVCECSYRVAVCWDS